MLSTNRSNNSIKPDDARRVQRVRRADLAVRLQARLRLLRRRVEHPYALISAIREANATVDPQKIATWLVRRAHEWVPAPCWTVIGRNSDDELAVLAEQGLTSSFQPSVWAAGSWVLRHGTELLSADLMADPRITKGGLGSVIAFPLICRHRTIGALVGLDSTPSSAIPAFGPSLTTAIRGLLEPAAIALNTAVALEKAEALSVTDDLTRLYNSRFLNQVLRRETKRAFRSGRPLSVVFLDLDGFKQVNDHHGHLAGSKALVEAAGVIRGTARETDVVARFGGDEFSLILPDTGREGALAVAERIRDRIRGFVFLQPDGLALHLTASIGVATLPGAAGSAEELLKAADTAMYKVKATGKDGIHVAEGQVS